MTNVSVLLVSSLALFSSWGRSVPVDVPDPASRDINEPIIPIDKIFPGIDAINPSTWTTNSTPISSTPSDVSSSQATELTSPSPIPPSSLLPERDVSASSFSTASSSTVSLSSTVSSSISPTTVHSTTTISTSTKAPETTTRMSEVSPTPSKPQSPLPSSLPTLKPPVTSTPIPPIIVKSPRSKQQRRPNNASIRRPGNATRDKVSSKRPDGQRPTNTPFRGRTPGFREQNVPKDSCDLCTRSCKKNKPICSKPIGDEEVDPDKLRGFPSPCHMDCFNICRKIRYEKVTDGRCGRLKDRFRPLDSKNKLTRIELNKTQYRVDNEEDPIYVFSPIDK